MANHWKKRIKYICFFLLLFVLLYVADLILSVPLEAVISPILLFALFYSLYAEKKKKALESQKRFEGQVAGVYAMFDLTDICSSYTSEELFKYAIKELERCRSLAKSGHSVPIEDGIYYASHKDFGEFALLCAIKYANQFEENPTTKAIIEFCESRLILARKLTARIPSPWGS